eukprot:COSAG06_NODE_243_length_19221_cov_15.057578_21_plen_111_part_00
MAAIRCLISAGTTEASECATTLSNDRLTQRQLHLTLACGAAHSCNLECGYNALEGGLVTVEQGGGPGACAELIAAGITCEADFAAGGNYAGLCVARTCALSPLLPRSLTP